MQVKKSFIYFVLKYKLKLISASEQKFREEKKNLLMTDYFNLLLMNLTCGTLILLSSYWKLPEQKVHFS